MHVGIPLGMGSQRLCKSQSGERVLCFSAENDDLSPTWEHTMQCRHNSIHLHGINCLHEVQQTMGLLNTSYLTRVKYYIWSCNAISFCSFSDDVLCLLKPPLGDQPPWRFRNDPAEKVQSNKPPFPWEALPKGPTHCSRQEDLQTSYISQELVQWQQKSDLQEQTSVRNKTRLICPYGFQKCWRN